MKTKTPLNKHKKTLYNANSLNKNMKKGCSSKNRCIDIIKEAKKEPSFNKEIDKFIKATAGIYKL